jgi:hypothetical protein
MILRLPNTKADALHEGSKVREMELVKFPTVALAKASENKHLMGRP